MNEFRKSGRKLTAAKNALAMQLMWPQKPADEQATDVLRRAGVKPKDERRPATAAPRQQIAERIAKSVVADPIGALRYYFAREKAANAINEQRKKIAEKISQERIEKEGAENDGIEQPK